MSSRDKIFSSSRDTVVVNEMVLASRHFDNIVLQDFALWFHDWAGRRALSLLDPTAEDLTLS
jgi:hypothetical protein